MAQTRGTTGHSKPRVFTTISTEPGRKTTTGRKRKAGSGTKKTGAGVKKAGRPSLKQKVSGAKEKVAGKIERKPGKKAAGTKKMKGTGTKAAPKKKATVTTTTTVV